jgi:hypothetical protein
LSGWMIGETSMCASVRVTAPSKSIVGIRESTRSAGEII